MDWKDNLLFWGGMALVVAFMALGIWGLVNENRRCEEAGGHMVSKSSVGTGMSFDGKMVMTTNTISFCISQDGRIIE